MSGSAQQLLEKAKTMLDEYNSTIEAGESPDLKEFDSVVRELCEEVTKLPKEEADGYKDALVGIGKSLEEVAKKLEEQKEKIQKEIEGLDYNQKAQTAYRTAEGLSEGSKE